MPEITKESLRIEKLCVGFKRLLLDFPVISRADLRNSFPPYSEEELDAAVARLTESGFITVAEGPRRGVRYVRSLESAQ